VRKREREIRLVRIVWKSQSKRLFVSLSRSRHPRTEREEKKKKIRARKRPRETTLANALVPESRRIRSKRTFERRSSSSNVPFFFLSLSSSAPFSLFLYTSLVCAQNVRARKNPPLQVFSLPHERKFRQRRELKHAYKKKKEKISLSKTGASRERLSRAKTPSSKEKDAYLGRKRSR
jgi:hypothetical protein